MSEAENVEEFLGELAQRVRDDAAIAAEKGLDDIAAYLRAAADRIDGTDGAA